MASLSTIPDDALVLVLGALPVSDASRCETVARRWRSQRDRVRAEQTTHALRNLEINCSARRTHDDEDNYYQKRIPTFTVHGSADAFTVSCESRFSGGPRTWTSSSAGPRYVQIHGASGRLVSWQKSPASASTFERVHEIQSQGITYSTLPGAFYIRLKNSTTYFGFPRVSSKSRNQTCTRSVAGRALIPEEYVTRSRRRRVVENHGFFFGGAAIDWDEESASDDDSVRGMIGGSR
mmetsp:Transcript_24407/g.75262  ORF Transcript_24407/g.75262 Transcript_24407/m.75262 type:complete len:236 (+) Transcript_24407:1058-1765(+)